MIRRALIVYCNDTKSGSLIGPIEDNKNYRQFLTSSLGGEWTDYEIRSLQNPTSLKIEETRQTFLKGADYTFVIFSGHGCINTLHSNLQYAEVSDGDISINKFKTDAPRQTIIFDSCRGLETFISPEITKAITEDLKMFTTGLSTRKTFDNAVLAAEEGLTVLYSASENQSSDDSDKGGVYLVSLIEVAKEWSEQTNDAVILPLYVAHKRAVDYLDDNFSTLQVPVILPEKRKRYFPFAVRNAPKAL